MNTRLKSLAASITRSNWRHERTGKHTARSPSSAAENTAPPIPHHDRGWRVFRTFAVHQAGHPSVVALMGSTLSQGQADLVTRHFDRVLLTLDGDKAGQDGTAVITSILVRRLRVTTISLKEDTQPDQLASGEIQRVVWNHSNLVGEGSAHENGASERTSSATSARCQEANGRHVMHS